MATSITIPKFNGDGSLFKLGLNVPASFVDAQGNAIVWTNTEPSIGAVAADHSGRAAVYTVVTTGSDVVTAEATVGTNGLVTPWQPGHLYKLGQEIVDQNGHIQQVTAGNLRVPTNFTPYAGNISNSPFISLAGGSASGPSGINGTMAVTGLSATVPSNWQVGDSITIVNATSAELNGLWVLSAVGTHSFSFTGYNSSTLSSASQSAGTVADTSKGGDASIFSTEQTGGDSVSGNAQFGTVLNSDGGGSNGDWPPQALEAISGNFQQFVPVATSSPLAANLAPVTFVVAGYSSGANEAGIDNGPAGIDTPSPANPWLQVHEYQTGDLIVDNNGYIQEVTVAGVSGTQYPAFSQTPDDTTTDNKVTWKNEGAATLGYSNDSGYVLIATYSEIGPNGLISYFDQAGNEHTGWVIEAGKVVFAESIDQPPAFSTDGGTTIDGGLVWTDEGAADSTASVSIDITVSAGAAVPFYYYALLG